MSSLRNSFFAFLTITAAVLVGRVLLSFALVTAAIAHTSYLTGAPMSVQQLASAVTGGFRDIADAKLNAVRSKTEDTVCPLLFAGHTAGGGTTRETVKSEQFHRR